MAANKLKSEHGFYANNKSIFKNGIDIDGTVNLSSISAGTIATGGKYLILDSGNNIVYQNTAATLSDIGAITDVVDDASPQLGGNLDLNSYSITGNGNININGSITLEGTTNDDYEVTLTGGDPTADRTIDLPDKSGTIALTSDITGGGDDSFINAIIFG